MANKLFGHQPQNAFRDWSRVRWPSLEYENYEVGDYAATSQARQGSRFGKIKWNQVHNIHQIAPWERGVFNPRYTWSKAAWGSPRAIGRRLGPAVHNLKWGAPLEAAFAVAEIVGSTTSEAVKWGTRSGRPEDYFAGARYGFHLGGTRALGGAVGGMVGGFIGGLTPLPILGPIIGGIVGGVVGSTIGSAMIKQYAYADARMRSNMMASTLNKRRITMGGAFADSQQAYTMRQTAVQEMSGSLMNARQYLGNEAAFFH